MWSRNWAIFAAWQDLPFALAGLLVLILLLLWWRQQSRQWLRVGLVTLFVAVVLSILSHYLFVVPPHLAGCAQGCTGWRGYPLPITLIELDGRNELGLLDFVLNTLMLWLFGLVASVTWRLVAATLRWESQPQRWKVAFVLLLVVLPWALLPRILNPPQPEVQGEDLRLANNARRAAEFTYAITGLWVQRLALEDVRRAPPAATGAAVGNQVCLRGYTYFFVPWRRYRISLDPNGASALELVVVPLSGSCWE